MLIRAYGLFWDAEEINWFPGSGKKNEFQLLGKRGRGASLRLADFRPQEALYVLYNNYGAYYVGLTSNLGSRLKQHRTDHHQGRWNRFSWLGFSKVLQQKGPDGLQIIKPLKHAFGSTKAALKDLEALTILVVNPVNANTMKFGVGKEWDQVPWDSRQFFLDKVNTHR